MTMYDDERVVTLLREVDLPPAPADRLTQVGRRVRARESRLMSGLAGVLALVLVGGVFGAASLRGDDDDSQVLTVAGAAESTAEAGTARVTIRIDLAGLEAGLPAGAGFLPKDPHLTGLVDFVHERFTLRGNITGLQMEQRGIGKDRWERISGGKWEHTTDTSSDGGFDEIDPSRLLSELTSRGKTLSTTRRGDRTVFRIRAPRDLFDQGDPTPGSTDVRLEVDGDQRVRELSFSEGQPGTGTVTITIAYDDFGIDVDVRPPPADQIVEGHASSSGSTEAHQEVTITGSAVPIPPEQACAMLHQLEQQGGAMSDEQKQAFDRMIAEIRKQCSNK
jgi:hypothetical protein